MEIFKITLNVEGKEIVYSFDVNDKLVDLDDKYGLRRYVDTKELDKARAQLAEMVKAIYSSNENPQSGSGKA